MQYSHFIPENTATAGAKRIGVYNSKGNRVGFIPLGNLAENKGMKQYSFGAISDLHLPVADSESDFIRALQYFNSTGFTCICGDLTNNGNDTQLARYKELVNTHANNPVYAVTGNHDTYTHGTSIETKISSYTGNPLYYTVTHGNDVFVMLGIKGEGALFTTAELQWFYETLEANRNKRCFVFQHCFMGYETTPTCGNANGMYHSYCWSGDGQTQLAVFKSLLAHYKNTVFFHGHSHLKFRLQDACDYANFDDSEGFKSVHIPSVTRPRQEDGTDSDTSPDYDDAGSEGYLVDVYENGIHLQGRDFVKGEYLPIASYWIDTALQTVDAGTYSDSTGTITT